MQTEVMFAGFGGQGILASGKILAQAAMTQGFEVAWVPSYGPEMRGGTAYCLVVISDAPIGSPIVKRPQHLVAMNRPSMEKFAPMLKPKGTILINTTLIPVDAGRDDLDQVMVPATALSSALGNSKAANVVALGAFIARTGILAFETLIATVKAEFAQKEKLVDLNLNALEAGRASALDPCRGQSI
ncbi:2-oxoacid:acceptor oxidoreductase family protein [Desulfatitalea alkaliphila]|uniref:2-oxoacid:acceptor oxidoreductase family protein n=1 Tax=Desulfatitalea alkaliphila TaxID=2929485 RepID=A0AA41RD31_9BACT|nr:2-oxoacid:acceptor oxidoreductase family protein [Desulfatitalea alkaliphila]